jgi:hypothetical protein
VLHCTACYPAALCGLTSSKGCGFGFRYTLESISSRLLRGTARGHGERSRDCRHMRSKRAAAAELHDVFVW